LTTVFNTAIFASLLNRVKGVDSMNQKFPVFAGEGDKVTPEFFEAMSEDPVGLIVCTACKRIHISKISEYFEELKQKINLHPDKYVIHQYSIPWFTFSQQQIVFACPCKFDAKIELAIWGHHQQVVDYILNRASNEKIAAQNLATQAAKASIAINDDSH